MTDPVRDSLDVDALIVEVTTNCAGLAGVAHEATETLTALMAELTSLADERRASADAARAGDALPGAGALAADVLEIATPRAEAAGVSVGEYLRAAVLAYSAGPRPTRATEDGDLAGRRHRVRDGRAPAAASTDQG
jgi:hypothetical protein